MRQLLSSILATFTAFFSLVLCSPEQSVAATHNVFVYDFYYSPVDITVNQDDTVRWIWVDDFHDVRSGFPPGQNATPYDDAFNSTVENANYTFEITFDRTVLTSYPAPANRYDYYCSPHYLEGMTGSVTVNRFPEALTVNGSGAQEVPPSQSTATISCTGELAADESSVTLTCNHDVVNPTAAHLHQATVSANGPVICTLNTASPINVNCPLTQAQANNLYSGEVYINIHSSAYPNGEVRGQIVRSASGLSISGKVRLSDGSGVSGVTISDGTNSTISTIDGSYTLPGLSSGVYFLSGSKNGYTVQPDTAVNPVLLNAQSKINQHFIAALGNVCIPDSDSDGVCDSIEADDGTNENDPGSYRDHFSSPIYSLWNGFLSMTNVLEIINKGSSAESITVSLYDSAGNQASQTVVTIPAKGQQDLIVNSLNGFAADAYGVVTIEFPEAFSGSIDGRMSYYRYESDNTHLQFAFAVPFTAPLRSTTGVTFNTFQPSLNPLEAGDVVAQWLAVVNLDSVSKSFTLTQYDQLGNPLSTQRVAVNPLSRVDIEAGHINPGPSRVGLHVLVPDDPQAPYLAQLFRYGLTADPNRYTFAFPLLAHAGNGEAQQISISRGAEAANWVELANILESDVGVQLNFYDSAGTLLSQQATVLGPHAQQHFNAGDVLAAGASGHVEILPNASNSVIGQSMFYFRYPSSGSISAMYGSHLSESFGTKIFGSYNLFLGMYDWLRVFNTSTNPITATLTLNLAGGQSYSEQLSLAARSGTDLGLHETAHFMTAPDSFGVIELESSAVFSLSAELLRLKSNEDGTPDFAMPTRVR